MAQIEVRGTTLAYDDSGHGGPPFLFVHGWACNRAFWQPQFDDLSRDHRCVSVDLRGCGESPANAPFDTTTAADDLDALIEALSLPPAIIAGHSLGGLVALLLNDRHPHRVLGIVLGDSPLTASSGGGFAQTVRVVQEAGSMQAIRDSVVERFFVDTTSEEIRERVRKAMLECPAEVGAGMLSNAEVFPARMGELLKKADQKPFMAIWGARPLGNPERLRTAAPLLRQEPMGDTGHFFQLEEPRVTTALLRAFEDDVRNDPRIASTLAESLPG